MIVDNQINLVTPCSKMQISLQAYFQKRLPKHSLIEQKISPLLNRVKHRHINSIHQLQADFEYDLDMIASNKRQNHKTNYPVFTYQPLQLTNKHNKPQNMAKISRKNIPSTLSVQTKRVSKTTHTLRHNPEECTIYLNPISKVKRHLIDYIDFHELQTVMHRQSDKQNAYQQFCKTIREKSSSLTKRRALSHQDRISLVENTEEDSQVQQLPFPVEEYGFRVTNRKKFWNATIRANGTKKTAGEGCLTVKSILSTIN